MRCLTLAAGLQAAGWDVAFATNTDAAIVVPKLRSHNITVMDGFLLDDTDIGRFSGAFARPDLVVIDHYRSTPDYERSMAGIAGLCLVFDDFATPSGLAEGSRHCDILVNTNIVASTASYAGRVPRQALVLAGSDYALIRTEIRDSIPDDWSAERTRKSPETIMLSFGFTDTGGITAHVAQLLLEGRPDLQIDAIMGPAAQGLDAIGGLAASHPNLRVFIDPPDMGAILAKADIAVGASGQSSYERCCFGLPSIAVVVVDNQLELAHAMAAQGAALMLDRRSDRFDSSLVAAFDHLLADADARVALSKSARRLCDGQGVERIVAAISDRLDSKSA